MRMKPIMNASTAEYRGMFKLMLDNNFSNESICYHLNRLLPIGAATGTSLRYYAKLLNMELHEDEWDQIKEYDYHSKA